ncbi:MAG TPA: PilX N-terminal domain-containing pilus assembly protein, partial [Nevskia sp.]|nr:PilX N-terminal domain-containing pilus assembly protein [Nevskia sp.]
MKAHGSPRRQQGAALATALLILIVLTLLGLAAMRGSRLELRLSQNAESRVNALQSAQAIADGVTQT